jgi:hypothetical protein
MIFAAGCICLNLCPVCRRLGRAGSSTRGCLPARRPACNTRLRGCQHVPCALRCRCCIRQASGQVADTCTSHVAAGLPRLYSMNAKHAIDTHAPAGCRAKQAGSGVLPGVTTLEVWGGGGVKALEACWRTACFPSSAGRAGGGGGPCMRCSCMLAEGCSPGDSLRCGRHALWRWQTFGFRGAQGLGSFFLGAFKTAGTRAIHSAGFHCFHAAAAWARRRPLGACGRWGGPPVSLGGCVSSPGGVRPGGAMHVACLANARMALDRPLPLRLTASQRGGAVCCSCVKRCQAGCWAAGPADVGGDCAPAARPPATSACPQDARPGAGCVC